MRVVHWEIVVPFSGILFMVRLVGCHSKKFQVQLSNENDFMASYFASPLVVSVILKKIWCSASTLLCTFVLVFSTKLFTCALRRQIWVFSCTLTFSMRPGCALFRNGPVREVARYPLFSVMHHFQGWIPTS